MTDSCVICGRVFNRQSKPSHAFDTATARYLGLKHSSCADRGILGVFRAGEPLDSAQRYAWLWLDRTRPFSLAADLLLTSYLDQRARCLEWWMSPENHRGQKTTDEIDAIRTELWQLELDYAEWLAETYTDGRIVV